MAAISPPLFLNVDDTYAAADLGLPYRDLVGEGVTASTGLVVTQRGAGANMSVDVAAGTVWITGDSDSDAQPTYRCHNDGTINVAISPANGANPRYDLVVAEVRDSVFSGVSDDWRVRVVEGTPAGSPVIPTLPDSAVPLAVVTVGAAVSSITNANIEDVRQPFNPDIASVGSAGMFMAGLGWGWVALDGSAVKRLRYPRLFAYLGTDYNTGGETSLQFRLPDLRNLFPAAAGDDYSVGDMGGEATHLLTAAESGVPGHVHGPVGTDEFFLISGSGSFLATGGSGIAFGSADTSFNTGTNTTAPAAQAHENRPPFFAMNFGIRA